VLTVEFAGAARGGVAGVRADSDVEKVEHVSGDDRKQVLRLIPRDKQSLSVGAIEAAARRQWLVTGLRSDPGRLDDVFRQITTTADVVRKSA
jgi:hypothetical protein